MTTNLSTCLKLRFLKRQKLNDDNYSFAPHNDGFRDINNMPVGLLYVPYKSHVAL